MGQAVMTAGHRNSTLGRTGAVVGHGITVRGRERLGSGFRHIYFAHGTIWVVDQDQWVCLVGHVSPPEAICDIFSKQVTSGVLFTCFLSINISEPPLSFLMKNLSKILPSLFQKLQVPTSRQRDPGATVIGLVVLNDPGQ